MWIDSEADGCIYDTVDCYHDCKGCMYGPPEFYKPIIKKEEKMDNRIFNVNGETDEMLLAALKLAFMGKGRNSECDGWGVHPQAGLLLFSYSNEDLKQKFPTPMDADDVYPMVSKWLSFLEASNIERTGWDAAADFDGMNEPGWRVYVEDWGHVAGRTGVICAVKPICAWYGR